MWPFEQDEERKAAGLAPEQQQALHEDLASKYSSAASSVDLAKEAEDADNRRFLTTLLEGLGQMATAKSTARGGPGINHGAFNQIRSGIDSQVGEARQRRQSAIDEVFAKDKLARAGEDRAFQAKQRQRQEGDWAREDTQRSEDDDPNSQKSRLYQALYQKYQPGQDYSGMSYNELKGLMPAAERQYELEQKRRAAGSGAPRTRERPYEYVDKDGNKRLGRYIEGQGLVQSNGDPIVAPRTAGTEFKTLAPEDQEVVKDLAKKNASKIAIANQIDAVMKNWDNLSEDQQVAQGRQLLKTLNSTEGTDAIGVEEAKRLGAKLEFALGNFTNDNPTQFGRDLEGFKTQAQDTVAGIRQAITSNQGEIDRRYGRAPKMVADDSPDRGATGGWGEAIAAPAGKAPEEMSDEELDAELGRLKGGRP